MAYRASFNVRFGDIDQAGIVYYPQFPHYFHVAMEEFFSNALKLNYATVILKHHMGLPTVNLQIDFKRPLHYGDCFEIAIHVLSIGKTSIAYGYQVYLEGKPEVLVKAQNTVVCIDLRTFAKIPVPGWLREQLEAYQKRCEVA